MIHWKRIMKVPGRARSKHSWVGYGRCPCPCCGIPPLREIKPLDRRIVRRRENGRLRIEAPRWYQEK